MQTSKISGILKSLASAKAAGKLNVILSAPQAVVSATTKRPINGTVTSFSKTGEAIIQTEFGNLRLFSSVSLKPGDSLLLYSSGFGENLKLKVMPLGQQTHADGVSIITNDSPEGEQPYAVFKMPNQLKALKTAVNTDVAPSPYQNIKTTNITQPTHIYNDPTSGSIIAFLSYIFSDKFDKNLKRTRISFIPDATSKNFAAQISTFIRDFSSIEKVYELAENNALDAKLRTDLINLAQTSFQLQGDNWKVSIIPIFTGDQYLIARFMSKKPEENQDEDFVPSKRFFVDLTSEGYGKIIVDGLVSYSGDKCSNTLVIKSETRFTDELQSAIYSAAEAASSTTGIPTAVTFHKLQKNDPDPFSDILQDYYKGKLNSLKV